MDEYISVNLGKALKTEGVGENRIQSVLSNFSCPRNPDIGSAVRQFSFAFTALHGEGLLLKKQGQAFTPPLLLRSRLCGDIGIFI